ncbi:hypothetical protein [Diplocloster hominis]|uniref:hypothetical protein n=1 Tax=Diplocloster hominis TaxID=3079010 RepID=UPI0031BAA643
MKKKDRKIEKENFKDRLVEAKLREYKNNQPDLPIREHEIQRTLLIAEKAFFQSIQERTNSYFDFLFQQAAYLRKRWWVLQFIILVVLWRILYSAGSNYYVQRSMGVLASVFVILVIPELWKNRSSSSAEIEGTAFFSLRQIYSARMLLFGMVDAVLLSAFFGTVYLTVPITIEEILFQFFLPFNVTCCICFRTLCCKRIASEYFAVGLSLLWIAVWILIILKEPVYAALSGPVWAGLTGGSFLYLIYAVLRVLGRCRNDWEVHTIWN